MAKVWNADLAHAAEVRVWYHMSKGSSKEFMWRKAHEAILAVEKEIRRFPKSGRVVNLPKLKERTTREELEAILRGEIAIVPSEMENVEPIERDYAQHPYLKRMQFRGGGYAILTALKLRSRDGSKRQFMYKSELLHAAQPFCDVTMDGGWGSANGWASIRSLLSHRLVLSCRGPSGHEEYHLSPEGFKFCEQMQIRWPQDGPPAPAPPVVSRSRSPPSRPRWAAGRLVSAAPTPCSAKRKVEVDEIEISSESERESDQVTLVVDERERLRDAEPRRFFERLQEVVPCSTRRRLAMGDFAWLQDGKILDLLVERKRIEDLVGRSALGDHLKQLRRMERSALQHPFFLIEGNTKSASSCTVYDTDLAESLDNAIYSKDDIDAFCAQLLLGDSKVGVMQSRDSAGTIRLLKSISQWIAWACHGVSASDHSLSTGTTLEDFEMQLPQDTTIPAPTRCSSTVRMSISRRLWHRLHQPQDTPTLRWLPTEQPELCGELADDFGADALWFVILDADLLLTEILTAADRLGPCFPAVAEAAAEQVAAKLPRSETKHRLLIVEGLWKAVQAFARSTKPSRLPREEILPCAELVVLLMDVRCEWRCRVHDSVPAEATKRFLQVMVQVALGARPET